VLGGGVDVVYPKENQQLYDDIINNNGLILSESPVGTQPIARHFPKRNRIVAGLCCATVVIEAKLDSGSLITAKAAFYYDREVMAVPGHAMEPKAKGTNALIKQQNAGLVENATDILNILNHSITPLFKEDDGDIFEAEELSLDETLTMDLQSVQDILLKDFINYVPMNINDIISNSDLPSDKIIASILNLELAGKIERQPGGMISLI
jgi:DNA processing protein